MKKVYEKYIGLFKTDEQLAREKITPLASREMVAGIVLGIVALGAGGAGAAIYDEVRENQHCEMVLDNPNASAEELNDCY